MMYSRDYFHTTELWGGFRKKNFQVMAFVPYLSIHKQGDDGTINSSGVGDATLLGNYLLFSKTTALSDNKRYFGHTLWVGGGIKLPTGHSNVMVNDPGFTVGDFTSTPGTGSTDFLLNLNHSLLIGNHGLVNNIAYKINTKNNQHYQYGNRFYVSSAYFYSLTAGAYTIRPSGGLQLVANAANRFQGDAVQYSAGYVLNGSAGVNLQRGKVGLLVNVFVPLTQNYFHGLTKANEQISAAWTYSF